MSICTSGVSQPKSGVDTLVAYNGTVLAGLIEEFLGTAALPLAALVGVLSFDTPSFCAADPPSLPSFTATDVANLVQESILGISFDLTSDAKFTQLLQHFAWYQLCECGSAPTPAPSAFTWPGGSSINSTGGSTSPSQCADRTFGFNMANPTFTYTTSGGDPRNAIDLVPLMFPNELHHSITDATYGYTFTALDVGTPPPVSSTFTLSNMAPALSPTVPTSISAIGYNASGAVVQSILNTVFYQGSGYSSPNPFTVPITSTVRYVVIVAEQSQTIANRAGTIEVAFKCASNNPFASPCCPPDPATNALLNQILTLVRLTQRQLAPFAYIASTAHTGLTGSGEIAVQGLLGAKVHPASIPNFAGVEAGDPDSLWLDSWIRWGNPDGWGQREFLTASPYVSLPNLAGQYTKLGYTLAPTLAVDITELTREP